MNRPAAKTVRRRFFTALGQAIHLAWPVLSTILAIQIALGLLIGFVEGWSRGEADDHAIWELAEHVLEYLRLDR